MSEETAIPKPQGVLQGIAATESERGKSTGISSEEQLKRNIRNIVAESETKQGTIPYTSKVPGTTTTTKGSGHGF